jgi:hypothetical protein
MELDTVHESNHEILKMIWGLEDMQKAMDALDPASFATKFLFEQAGARARRELGTPSQSVMGIKPANVSQDAQEIVTSNLQGLEHVRDSVQSFHRDMKELMLDVRRTIKKDYELKKEWDAVGLPPTRS